MDKKRDDEKLFWFIGGGLFTVALILVDIFFSSWSLMREKDSWLFTVVLICHSVLVAAWGVVMVKFNDPNYDPARKFTVKLAAAILIVVALHRAIVGEDARVLIDANNEKKKDSIEKAKYDSAYQHHTKPVK